MSTSTLNSNKGNFVANLHVGERDTLFLLLRSLKLRPLRKGGKFLELQLGDKTGVIMAKVWEGGEDIAPTLAPGMVVKVMGDVTEYQGALEISVTKVRLAKEDEYDLGDLLPTTEKSIEELWGQVYAAVERISANSPALGPILRHFYDNPDFVTRLKSAVATGKAHHQYLGGLLEHIVEILTISETFCKLWPQLDGDLLATGALLAPLGRMHAFDAMTFDETDDGELMGHVALSLELLTSALAATPSTPEETARKLRHMILAQNGRPEWGSPRKPQTLEAMALYHALDSSAWVSRFAGLLAAKPFGQTWTERDVFMGRALYSGSDMPPDAPESE